MKYTLILSLLFCGCAHWDGGDTARQLALTGLLAADYAQTKTILDDSRWEELNPLITTETVDFYFPACAVGHFAVAAMLPKKWRERWQILWIGAQGATVVYNHANGVRP